MLNGKQHAKSSILFTVCVSLLPSIHSSNCIEEQNSQEVIAIQFVFSPYHCWCRYYFTCGVYSLVLALCCNIIQKKSTCKVAVYIYS